MRRLHAIVLAAFLVPMTAGAQEGPRDPRVAWLRFYAAPGAAVTLARGTRISTGGGEAALQAGGYVARNLVLAAELSGGLSANLSNVAAQGEFRAGGTLQYCVMPANVVIGVGVNWIYAQLIGIDLGSPWTSEGHGVEVHVDVGKQWRVTPSWSFGLAARAGYARLLTPDESHLVTVSLGVTATYD